MDTTVGHRNMGAAGVTTANCRLTTCVDADIGPHAFHLQSAVANVGLHIGVTEKVVIIAVATVDACGGMAAMKIGTGHSHGPHSAAIARAETNAHFGERDRVGRAVNDFGEAQGLLLSAISEHEATHSHVDLVQRPQFRIGGEGWPEKLVGPEFERVVAVIPASPVAATIDEAVVAPVIAGAEHDRELCSAGVVIATADRRVSKL